MTRVITTYMGRIHASLVAARAVCAGGGARTRWLSAFVAASAMLLLSAPAVFAGYNVLTPYNYIYSEGVFGPRHSLTYVQAYDTRAEYPGACVNALNADGTGWAGTTYCTQYSLQWVSHPYCGCKLRYGFLYASPNTVPGYGEQDW